MTPEQEVRRKISSSFVNINSEQRLSIHDNLEQKDNEVLFRSPVSVQNIAALPDAWFLDLLSHLSPPEFIHFYTANRHYTQILDNSPQIQNRLRELGSTHQHLSSLQREYLSSLRVTQKTLTGELVLRKELSAIAKLGENNWLWQKRLEAIRVGYSVKELRFGWVSDEHVALLVEHEQIRRQLQELNATASQDSLNNLSESLSPSSQSSIQVEVEIVEARKRDSQTKFEKTDYDYIKKFTEKQLAFLKAGMSEDEARSLDELSESVSFSHMPQQSYRIYIEAYKKGYVVALLKDLTARQVQGLLAGFKLEDVKNPKFSDKHLSVLGEGFEPREVADLSAVQILTVQELGIPIDVVKNLAFLMEQPSGHQFHPGMAPALHYSDKEFLKRVMENEIKFDFLFGLKRSQILLMANHDLCRQQFDKLPDNPTIAQIEAVKNSKEAGQENPVHEKQQRVIRTFELNLMQVSLMEKYSLKQELAFSVHNFQIEVLNFGWPVEHLKFVSLDHLALLKQGYKVKDVMDLDSLELSTLNKKYVTIKEIRENREVARELGRLANGPFERIAFNSSNFIGLKTTSQVRGIAAGLKREQVLDPRFCEDIVRLLSRGYNFESIIDLPKYKLHLLSESAPRLVHNFNFIYNPFKADEPSLAALTLEQVNQPWLTVMHAAALEAGYTYKSIEQLNVSQVLGIMSGLTPEQVSHDWFKAEHVKAIQDGISYDQIQGLTIGAVEKLRLSGEQVQAHTSRPILPQMGAFTQNAVTLASLAQAEGTLSKQQDLAQPVDGLHDASNIASSSANLRALLHK